MIPWRATHRITFTPRGERPTRACRVMLTAEGAAYTRSEWEAYDSAAWELDPALGWLHYGQATPNGTNGVVVVEALP